MVILGEKMVQSFHIFRKNVLKSPYSDNLLRKDPNYSTIVKLKSTSLLICPMPNLAISSSAVSSKTTYLAHKLKKKNTLVF
jgi:hypothetical protein